MRNGISNQRAGSRGRVREGRGAGPGGTHFPATQEAEAAGAKVRGKLGQLRRPCLEINNENMRGGLSM